ncbi:uncharacterized protein LOC131155871 [Malania oleifera]|uniref:uncharacterized protein LOC131155871 n=1 Tax=Malania oleifera TaxID=397392 RepID=UPI0025ADDC8B|nr:uncharacterized protein LOC131155871 [Malania oleifera]
MAQREDPELVEVTEGIQKGLKPDFSISGDGILRFRNRVFVPNDAMIKRVILEEAHHSLYTIHPAQDCHMQYSTAPTPRPLGGNIQAPRGGGQKRNTAPARVYVLMSGYTKAAGDVVIGATHLFMSLGYVKMTGVETQLLDTDLSIVTPTRSIVRCGRLLSAIQARRLLLDGCHGYLAFVKEVSEGEIENISVMRDFPSVFPEDFLGLSPDPEVEFVIDLVLGTALISKGPYRMAPIELKELKE